MTYVVDFANVSTAGLESSPVADALAGLRANEARYFANKYDHVFTVESAAEVPMIVDWVNVILTERDIVVASKPLEVSQFTVENIKWTYVFYENGLSINVLYTLDGPDPKRAVGFKLSDGMEVPAELSGFKFARQRSKLAGTIRGSYFVIKGEYAARVQPADSLHFAHGPDWRNRLALAPLTNRQSHPDGTLSDDEVSWLTARGEGGFGLVMTAAAFVAPAGHVWRGQLGIDSDDRLPELRRLADGLRAAGACSAVQLHHGGRRAERAVTGRAAQCPWDDPDHDAVAMTGADIEATVADFVAAAVRAQRAGFDGVEVHGAHGYLLGQFLDTMRNHRTDGYGGSPANRFRIIGQVLEGIRAATGDGFQLGLRLSPEGFGTSLADGREYARLALESGLLDYLDMSLWDVFMKPRKGGDGLLIDHFVDLPRGSTRLGVAGKILSTADAQWCLDRGADFVTVGRAAIVHHDFAARALADAAFRARTLPVPVDVLRAERVGPAFVDYLIETFPDIVEV